MDTLAFIASVIGSVAWPGAVVTIALSQRKALSDFVGRIKSAKAFGAEIGIAEEIEAVRERVDLVPTVAPPSLPQIAEIGEPHAPASTIVAPAGDGPVTTDLVYDPLAAPGFREIWAELGDELANTSAIGSIVATWIELENGVRAMAAIYGLTDTVASFNTVLKYLRQHDVLSDATVLVIRSLRDIRNRAVHSGVNGVMLSDAQHFRETSRQILQKIGATDELSFSTARSSTLDVKRGPSTPANR